MRYLQTRSTSVDYDFFGPKTASWWATSYGQYTVLENFTVILELSPSQQWQWRIYIGGIPSNRRDRFGRQIHYALAGDGSDGQAGEDAVFFHKVLYFLLNPYSQDVFQRKGRLLELGKQFDGIFDQSYIDGLDHDRHSDTVTQDIAAKLKKLGEELPEVSELTTAPIFTRPSAAIVQRNTIVQFLHMAKALKMKSDKPLTLAILNLPPTEEDIQSLWQKSPNADSLLLFVYEGLSPKDPASGLLFDMAQKKTPLPISRQPEQKSQTAQKKIPLGIIGIAVFVALLIIIVALIASRGKTSKQQSFLQEGLK
ncbi:MAG: hypothetical protein LBU17_01350, partial [Treponema sp.]|nr:hypothetical protein [Treponema sp.]